MIDLTTEFEIMMPEPGIYHMVFDHQRDLAQSMMRLQEHYEGASDLIRGRYFTLEQFLHHFTDEDGIFAYTHVWSGFNVPGHVVTAWEELFRANDGLTSKEQRMMQALHEARSDPDRRWYLIATAGIKDTRTVNHEIAHARFYLDGAYQESCERLVYEIPKADRNKMARRLLKMGYTDSVITDEIQAYLSTSDTAELEYRFGPLKEGTKRVIKSLRALFKEGMSDAS